MAKLIQKSGYIHSSKAGGYMKYIATREGVQVRPGSGPVSKKQEQLIQQILRDFPDCEDLFEYEDYLASPTAATASAFISVALDANAYQIAGESGYMKYISLRPGAELHGTHGLFGAAPAVDLSSALKELEQHGGNVWTVIYSLRREDAARLGYDNADAWRSLLLSKQFELAKAMKIEPQDFRWYAAFHDAGHHPHIHMMVWSADPAKGYLTKDGIKQMRSAMTTAIFQNELLELYQRKDVSYKELTEKARQVMGKLSRELASGIRDGGAVAEKLLALSNALDGVSGKKQYGYLKKPLKAMVDSVVDELENIPEVAACYQAWNAIRDEQESYYHVAVIDLRNPTRSDGFNFLTLVNHYMDVCRDKPDSLSARAGAEKYAKILSKTIMNQGGDEANYGQNQFFYDAAEGLLTAVILLLAEFLPPKEIDGELRERRHIVSVFKLVQDLLAPSKSNGKNGFQSLMSLLPPEHKARWFAGAALNSAEQTMASVMSTVLSRLNAFLDTEMEQTLCFDSAMDAESFASQKSAIFLILPEEDPSKNFMASLMIQNLSRELFSVADENGGKLKNRVVLFCDEFGTMPAFDVLPLFSAGRSRRLTLVPIIQSLAQLEKNYGKEGAEIIVDNVQDTIFGGFAPQSQTAETLSKALGSRTVLSGSVSKGKNDPSRTLQMMERPLMTPDELKSLPKGKFIVMKTGAHPIQTRLHLFLDWGITFKKPYVVPERAARKVYYANVEELKRSIRSCYPRSDNGTNQWSAASDLNGRPQ